MKQQTFSDIEYSKRKRRTKRDEFLEIMNEIIPWEEWAAFIVPYYYKGKRSRPPKGIEKMLRMYLLQMWFNLSDEGVEDAIYDSYAMRKFMGINFCEEQVPDATTLLRFRHIMEKHNLGQVLFNAIRDGLEKADISCMAVQSLMQQSLKRQVRQRTKRRRVIRKCIKPRRETSGILE